MPSPADLPRCISHDPRLRELHAQTLPFPATTSASPFKRILARSSSTWRALPHRYLRHGFVALSIPATILMGALLPPAPQHEPVAPVAATYAVQSSLHALTGDLTLDTAALTEALTPAATSDYVVDMALGHSTETPSTTAKIIVGKTTDDNVNLRQGPGTENPVIAKLPSGTTLEVIGERAGWYRVATARGTVGWVTADFFTITGRPVPAQAPSAAVAMVRLDRVNLRQGPSTDYGSYGKLAQGTQLTVLARNGQWLKVRSPRGTEGWVAADLVSLDANLAQTIPVTNEVPALSKPAPAAAPTKATAARTSAPAAASADAASIARRYVGARYVWGGASPSGFDCSGLTKYVYQQLGLNLPHKAALQYNVPGQRLGRLGDLAPGDLVFFVRTTPTPGITHVGIYTGSGRMVTAGTPQTGVQEVNVYSQYWASRFAGGVRPYR
jgi:cell wall-associated NlpC family hydrolase